MTLPESLREPVLLALRAAGDDTALLAVHPVGGGCINQVRRLVSGQRSYLLKWNQATPAGLFTAEACGLELLRQAQALTVPSVFAANDGDGARPGFLLQEWLAPSAPRSPAQDVGQLGVLLARQHRSRAAAFGLDHDNFIGATVQPNNWHPSWVAFFREARLAYQIALARRNGLLPLRRAAALERLLERLDNWLVEPEAPSLLHGDLWDGNVLAGPKGPALIDPAVYYGHREAEIAFTELFGGFGARFYTAYHEAWPLDPGYAERRDLYNLYHLLNHLNLFGEGYGSAVDAILARYVGG